MEGVNDIFIRAMFASRCMDVSINIGLLIIKSIFNWNEREPRGKKEVKTPGLDGNVELYGTLCINIQTKGRIINSGSFKP